MQDITNIDKNFMVKTEIDKDDIKFYNAEEAQIAMEHGCESGIDFGFASMAKALEKLILENGI